MGLATKAIHQGDSVALLEELDAGSIDLVFADPPFNIGYDYDVYDDRQEHGEYLDWSRQWMAGVARALKDDGTFWLAIGDDYAAELKLIAQNDLGLTTRSWVLWYYTFGVNCKRKFSRSHTHLFHFVKDPEQFTFNAEDPAVRVPSARQLVYGDKRANSKGRLPDDTWILRPQDLPEGFQPMDDTWYYARVAGTFKERAGFHGCQMPEQLLGRIVRVSSDPGATVLDPFSGSGSTLAVAKKLDRDWIGFDLSEDYVTQASVRLDAIKIGDPLDGPADPVASSPKTSAGVRLGKNGERIGPKAAAKETVCVLPAEEPRAEEVAQEAQAEPSGKKRRPLEPKKSVEPRHSSEPNSASADHEQLLIDAYLATHQGHSTDRLLADPKLNRAFVGACRASELPGKPADWNHDLMRLRKAGKLPRLESRAPQTLSTQQMEDFQFASEIALAALTLDSDLTVDELLCRPSLAAKFDKLAKSYAPGHTPLEYRWAALSLRKRASSMRKNLAEFGWKFNESSLPEPQPLGKLALEPLNEVAGVYLLRSRGTAVYAGETHDLGRRLALHQKLRQEGAWKTHRVTSALVVPEAHDRHALLLRMIEWFSPVLNYAELVVA